MTKSIFKSILAGVLFGAAMFIMPFFLIQLFVVMLLFGAAFRLFAGRNVHGRKMMYAQHIRNMSDEEFAKFKSGNYHSCRKPEHTEFTEVKS
jgi:hypothetical protein